MWVPTLLALLLCALCFILCTESPIWEYHFVNKYLTWSEAQQFCRQHYHDLACVSSSEDNFRLPRPPGYTAPVWIGLYDDPKDLSQWKWTATNSTASYQNWRSDEPGYFLSIQLCGVLHSHGWYTHNSCYNTLYAACYSGSSPKVFHLSNIPLTWFDALTYCRTHYTDLAMIESPEENTAALAVAHSSNPNTWFGLYRPTGKWSDNRPVTFVIWFNQGAAAHGRAFCAVQTFFNSWEVSSCDEEHPFYCQDEPKTHKRFVKMKFSGLGLDGSVIDQDILAEIQKRFEAAGLTDVKLKWSTAPEKQEEKKEENKDKPEECPSEM